MVDGSAVSGIYFCTWRTRRGLCICNAYFCLWGAVEFNCPLFFFFFPSPCDCLEVIIFPSCHLRWFPAKTNFSLSQTTAQSVSARCYETNTRVVFFGFFFLRFRESYFLCDPRLRNWKMTLCHANQWDVSQTRCSSDPGDGVSLEKRWPQLQFFWL